MPPNCEPSSIRTLLQLWTLFSVLGLLGPFFAQLRNMNQSHSEIKKEERGKVKNHSRVTKTLLTCNFSFKCMTISLVKNKLNSLISGGPTHWSTSRLFQSKAYKNQGYMMALPFRIVSSKKQRKCIWHLTLLPLPDIVFRIIFTRPLWGPAQRSSSSRRSFPNLPPHFTSKSPELTSMFAEHFKSPWQGPSSNYIIVILHSVFPPPA